MKNRKHLRRIVIAAFIAAVYTALTYATAAAGLAYGQVQFRLSEAMCVLAAFTPAAIPGLTVGCLLSNIGSTLGPIDWICGTLATLLASVAAYYLRNVKIRQIPWLVPLPSIVFNGLIVGTELACVFGDGNAFLPLFAINALWVAIGELAVCYVIGIPLYVIIDRCKPLKRLISV